METIMENLAKALCAAQSEFGTVPQSGHNPFHKSKYSTLKDCWDTARPVLARHGLSVLQMPDTGEDGRMFLLTIVMHESGENISARQPVMAAKQDAQSFGSALSYARRYGLTSALGLVSGDEDDDGNAATNLSNKQANPPKIQPPATSPAPVTPSKKERGTPNATIEERVSAAPHLGGLTALYDGLKGEIEAMDEDKRNEVLALFKQRKTELTKG
jgi:hypothetical protein